MRNACRADARQARPDHGGRQRPLDRLGHRQGARRAQGAKLAFTYQGDALAKRVKPLAASVRRRSRTAVRRRGYRARVDQVFAEIGRTWGTLDFLVHAIAFSDKTQLTGRYADTTRENFLRTMLISCFAFTEAAKRARGADAGRRRHAHADLQWRRARDAELQRHGRRQGGAGSVGALSRGRFRRAGDPGQRHFLRADPHARRRRHRRRAHDVRVPAAALAAAPRRDARRARRRRRSICCPTSPPASPAKSISSIPATTSSPCRTRMRCAAIARDGRWALIAVIPGRAWRRNPNAADEFRLATRGAGNDHQSFARCGMTSVLNRASERSASASVILPRKR